MIGLSPNEAVAKWRDIDAIRWRVLELQQSDGSDVIPAVLSTDAVVEMRDGPEILQHTSQAVDLSRAPLPLVDSHNTSTSPYGVVENVHVAGGKLRGFVKFGNSERARELLADVKAGVLRSLSVGYHILKFHYENGVRVVTSWSPYEVSCVATPADIGAGFYRSAEQVMEVTESERDRCAGIVRTARMFGAEPSALEAITSGESLSDYRQKAVLASTQHPAALGLSPKERRSYSVFKALAALRSEDYGRAPFERECSSAIFEKNADFFLDRGISSSHILVPTEVLCRPLGDAAIRALSTQPGSAGGYLVGVDNLGFVDVLRARAVLRRLGAQFVSGLTANAVLARGTGTVTVTWQAADGTSVTATDQTLGQLSFTPRSAIAIADVSEQMLTLGGELAEQFFLTDLARATAVAVDKAGLVGAGGAEPLGIRTMPGVTTGADLGTATYAKTVAVAKTSAAANAAGAFGFVANAASAEILANRFINGTGSRPVWDGALTDGLCVGYPAMASEQMPAATVIFGPWDEVVVADWGVLALSMSRGGTRFNNVQVGIRALWMVDVLVRRPAAFVVSTNLS